MAKKGSAEKGAKKVVEGLTHVVSDTFVLYVKTLNFHWNMIGAHFFMYHKLLEEQYKEMATAIDDLSERIRQLGHWAPGSLREFLN
jgi:starvation-inducible DNA-binding protein